MRSNCIECGNPTNKNFVVCSRCRMGSRRISRICEDCRTGVGVSKDPGNRGHFRCRPCMDKRLVEHFLEVARPILEHGGSHAEIGKSLHLSRERVRQIMSNHDELKALRKKTLSERVVDSLRPLLEAGDLVEEAAQSLRVSIHTLKSVFRTHLELRALSKRNRAQRMALRFDPVFQLVEQEGMSICAACRFLGIRCRMSIYKIARTDAAQNRFPKLKQTPRKHRFIPLKLDPMMGTLRSTG